MLQTKLGVASMYWFERRFKAQFAVGCSAHAHIVLLEIASEVADARSDALMSASATHRRSWHRWKALCGNPLRSSFKVLSDSCPDDSSAHLSMLGVMINTFARFLLDCHSTSVASRAAKLCQPIQAFQCFTNRQIVQGSLCICWKFVALVWQMSCRTNPDQLTDVACSLVLRGSHGVESVQNHTGRLPEALRAGGCPRRGECLAIPLGRLQHRRPATACNLHESRRQPMPSSDVQGSRAVQPAARLLSLASDAQPRAAAEPPPPSPAPAEAGSEGTGSAAAAGAPQQQWMPRGNRPAGDKGRFYDRRNGEGADQSRERGQRSRDYRNQKVSQLVSKGRSTCCAAPNCDQGSLPAARACIAGWAVSQASLACLCC